MDEVKQKVYAALVYPEIQSQLQAAANKRDIAEIERISALLHDDSYAMEKLNTSAHDTYVFIKNLEAESLFLEDMQ